MDEDVYFTRRWVHFGIICGLLAGITYGLPVSGLLPGKAAYFLFFFFGPLLCASAGGFYHFIKHHRNSVSLQVGTLFLIISGALVTLMTSMQGALKAVFQNIFIKNGSQSAQIAREMALKSGDALQLGADIAWDLFVFLSVIFLSLAALNHPRLGWMFALPGILIGLVGLGFNLCTFPHNPGTAGLIDTGPLVGLWFTAVSIRVLFSFKWLEHK